MLHLKCIELAMTHDIPPSQNKCQIAQGFFLKGVVAEVFTLVIAAPIMSRV